MAIRHGLTVRRHVRGAPHRAIAAGDQRCTHLPRPSAGLPCRLPTAQLDLHEQLVAPRNQPSATCPTGSQDPMPSHGPLTAATAYSPQRLCVEDIGGHLFQRAYRLRQPAGGTTCTWGYTSPCIDPGGLHSRETYLPAIGDSRTTQDLSAPSTASPSGTLRLSGVDRPTAATSAPTP